MRHSPTDIKPLILAALLGSGHGAAAAVAPAWDGIVRVRPEYRGEFHDFQNTPSDSPDFVASLARAGARATVREGLSARIAFQAARLYGERAAVREAVRLHEGYLEKAAGGWVLRLGRQELGPLGTEFLVGDEDFYDGRAFDAVNVRRGRARFWFSQLTEEGAVGGDDETFSGAWWGGSGIEAYALANRNFDLGPHSGDSTYSLGFRLFRGSAASFEAVRQIGDGGSESVEAWAMEAGASSSLLGAETCVVGALAGAASGDRDPADDVDETFNPLFQEVHGRYGYSDLIRLSNLLALRPRFEIAAAAGVVVGVQAVWARVMRAEDAKAPENFGPGNIPSASKDLGREADVIVLIDRADGLRWEFAWARFWPGDYVRRNLSRADPIDRVYLQAELRF